MSQTCSRCNVTNADRARFCQGCGTPLGATNVQGRTVVLPPSPSSESAAGIDRKTILQRVQKAFGSQPALPAQTMAIGPIDQREQTAIVTDVSYSMREEFDNGVTKLAAADRASVNLILNKAQIDPKDEIALITFHSVALVLMGFQPIASHKREMIQELQSLSAGGGTDINEGLLAAGDLFDWNRQDVVRRIVLLTDGHGGYPLCTAKALKSQGVVLDVVAVGPDEDAVDTKLLRKIASEVAGELRYEFIKDHRSLIDRYTQLANKTATST